MPVSFKGAMHLAPTSLLERMVQFKPDHVPLPVDDRVMVAKAVFQRLCPVEMERVREGGPRALLAFWRKWERLQPLRDLLDAAHEGPEQLKEAIRRVLPSRADEAEQQLNLPPKNFKGLAAGLELALWVR